MFKPDRGKHLFRGLLLLLATATAALALNDPTRPPSLQGADKLQETRRTMSQRLDLTSILVAPERQVATINGQPVQVGERIGGARVVEIRFGAVVLKYDNRLITLTPKSGVVKKPVMLPAKGQ